MVRLLSSQRESKCAAASTHFEKRSFTGFDLAAFPVRSIDISELVNPYYIVSTFCYDFVEDAARASRDVAFSPVPLLFPNVIFDSGPVASQLMTIRCT